MSTIVHRLGRNTLLGAAVLVSGLTLVPSALAGQPSATVTAAAQQPTCFGQPATHVAQSFGGNLVGTRGRDVIVGSERDDNLLGLDGDDLICGRGGNDTLRGGGGNDRLDCGSGSDSAIGDFGTDTATSNCEGRSSIP